MTKSISIAARIPEELDTGLENLAQATGRSKSWLVKQAVAAFVASEQDFIDAVEKGLASVRAGDVIEHDQVVADLESKLGAKL